jgi:hypothetical protein
MIHYSCDRCHSEIDPEHDLRFVVRMEIEAAIEPSFTDTADDHDHLDDLEELLDSSVDGSSATLGEELFQAKRFDLCLRCYRQFVKNPLSKEAPLPFGFSQN